MAGSAIILYLGFQVGLISHFDKFHAKISNKLILNYQVDFNEIYVRCSSKKDYLRLFKSF